jgi:alpha-tubulin suppressor-like RCC1 family protein
LDTNGSVYCWGDNRNFELGTTSQGFQGWGFIPTPQSIALPYPATAITSGTDFNCALLTGPTISQWNIQLPEIWCWGNDTHAELGDGSNVGGNKWQPVPVQGLNLFPAAVSAGFQGACALDSSGNEQCWGDSLSGEIGMGVPPASGIVTTATAVLGGPFNVMATGGDRDNFNCSSAEPTGGLWCWGNNYWNQLTSDCNGSSCDSPIEATLFDANVIWPNVAPIAPTEISGGVGHICAIASLSNVQHVYCWGHNDFGQVGNGDTSFSYWFSYALGPELIL